MAGNIFGKTVLAVATRPAVAAFAAESPVARGLVSRFVAGETLDEAVAVVRRLNALGFRVALDPLGENTTSREEAITATDEAIHALEQTRFGGLDAYVSVKLTQLGLDVGEYVVRDNLLRLLDRARTLHNFVRLDMEGSSYTARTIELFTEMRRRYDNVGIVIQAYLYRSMADVRDLIGMERVSACARAPTARGRTSPSGASAILTATTCA
jgi:proline dehydrogenase